VVRVRERTLPDWAALGAVVRTPRLGVARSSSESSKSLSR
jgi:hypothetical protein